MNQDLFILVNNLAGKYVWLDRLAVFFADYIGYILLAFLIFLPFLKAVRVSRFAVLTALTSAAVSRGIITNLIRFFYHNPRPFDVLTVKQLIPESGFSFPSGHAAFYFAISAAVYLHSKKLGILFFTVSALMGLARIYVGVHWPADILGGILVGVTSAIGINFLSKKVIPERQKAEKSPVQRGL